MVLQSDAAQLLAVPEGEDLTDVDGDAKRVGVPKVSGTLLDLDDEMFARAWAGGLFTEERMLTPARIVGGPLYGRRRSSLSRCGIGGSLSSRR